MRTAQEMLPCFFVWAVLVDLFSRAVQVTLCIKTNSRSVIRGLQRWIETFSHAHRPVETLMTDNGSGFVSQELAKWLTPRGIRHMRSAVYSPWSNGTAERMVGTLKGRAERMAFEGPVNVQRIEDILNDAHNEGTDHTANEIVWGRCRDGTRADTAQLERWRAAVRERRLHRQSQVTDRWKRRKKRHGTRLHIGDEVLLYQPEKRRHALESPWLGPFVLTERRGRVQWRMREKTGSQRTVKGHVHVNRLKKYRGRSAQGSL